MINLIVIYKFQKHFFVAGTFSCTAIKNENEITLQMKNAKYDDKLFIKNAAAAENLIKNFQLKEFFPIKTYFEYEGYEIDDEDIDKIKDKLGAEMIWVNFQESNV